MKRIVALLSVVVMLVGMSGMAVAEERKFDQTVYENAPGYKYDKFDKRWEVSAKYIKKYSNANLVFGLAMVGTKTSISSPPYIFGWIRDVKNKTGLSAVKKVDILIDDVLFSLDAVIGDEDSWSALLDSVNGKVFLEKVMNAKEISLKYRTKTSSITVDLTEKDIKDFKELAKMILGNDSWAFVLDDSGRDATAYDEIINKRWPMEIEE